MNSELRIQIEILSDVLEINEIKAAVLCNHGINQQSQYDKSPLETAIILYYTERHQLLDCLVQLIGAPRHGDNIPEATRKLFEQHVSEIFEVQRDGNNRTSLLDQIIQSFTNIKSQILALQDESPVNANPLTIGGNTGNYVTGGQLLALQTNNNIDIKTLISSRVQHLLLDQKYIVYLLLLIARFNNRDSTTKLFLDEIKKFNTTEITSIQFLIAVLTCFKSDKHSTLDNIRVPERNNANEVPQIDLELDDVLVNTVSGLLDESVVWGNSAIKSVICLKWAVILQREGERRMNFGGGNDLAETSDRFTNAAIRMGVIDFILSDVVIVLENRDAASAANENFDKVSKRTANEFDADIASLEGEILQELIVDFVRAKSRIIKTLRKHHEDAEQSGGGGGRMLSFNIPVSGDTAIWSAAFDKLLRIIAILYSDQPDSGLIWWFDNHLKRFLKMVTDVKSTSLLQSGLDMLASLSTGNQCATQAYAFMNSDQHQEGATGGFITSSIPWTMLFQSLETSAQSLNQNSTLEMNPIDVKVLCSFLKLLRQVIKFSPLARVTLYESQHFRAVYTLFFLLVCRVPVELKASLFLAIAAFCIPIGVSSNIAIDVWQLLDQSQVLAILPGRGSFNLSWNQSFSLEIQNNEGIVFDLEETETQKQTYPETLAFLHLLNNLVNQPKNREVFIAIENLGSGSRTPGIFPYLSFVFDKVLLKIETRQFLKKEEKWQMTESCLKFLHRNLMLFDLNEFTDRIEAISEIQVQESVPQSSFDDLSLNDSGKQGLATIITHPGFYIYSKILSGSKLTEFIFRILRSGVEFLNAEGFEIPSISRSIQYTLRIILRILQTQRIFLDYVVPSITENNVQGMPIPSSLVGIDHLLTYEKETIIQIASYVNCDNNMDICLSTIKILDHLSRSSAFIPTDPSASIRGEYGGMNRLVTLLDSSEESRRIIYGFYYLLELDSESEVVLDDKNIGIDDISDNLSEYDEVSTTRKLDLDFSASEIDAVRLAILDLLLSDLKVNRSASPTLSHFLLGYSVKKHMSSSELKDPVLPDSKLGCLNVILDLLRRGMPQTKQTESEVNIFAENDESYPPLFKTHPILAEKCYHLIYELCASPAVSGPTMRYLRNRENFVVDQLLAISLEQEPNDPAMKEDILSSEWPSLLCQRAWLMKLVALELHVTSILGQRRHTQKILDILFINTMLPDENRFHNSIEGTPYEAEEFQQPLTKILEILNSLEFDISGIDVDFRPVTRIFNNIKLDFTITGRNSSQIFDIRKIYSILQAALKIGEQTGEFVSLGQRTAAKEEIRLILQGYLDKNQKLELISARQQAIEAWCQIVNTTVARTYDLIPAEIREEKVHELLATLLPKINSARKISQIVNEKLSIVILSLMSSLRIDRSYQAILQNSAFLQADSGFSFSLHLPVESLQQIVLKNVVDAIIKPGTTETVRGNYYAALICYLQYTKPDEVEAAAGLGSKLLDNVESSSAFSISVAGYAGSSNVSYNTSLTSGNLATLNSYGERLLEILCRDSSDGSDLWKTVSFSVLDALVDLASKEQRQGETNLKMNSGNRIINFMVKRNFLGHFVKVLKKEDSRLQSILLDDPETLNPLYIFESKISLFLRVAQQKEGAERLFEVGIFDIMSELNVLDQKPDESSMEIDSFFPQSLEKYQQILLPSLQLLTTICAHFGQNSSKISQKASQLILSHRDVFANILKDNENATTITSLRLPGAGNISFCKLLLGLFGKYSGSLLNIRLLPTNDNEIKKSNKSNRMLWIA
ncbi:hypothetical protein HK096_003517 [Nowakowskiella sp. JEL0078]|nr:hypothetical protein HK096_003517 [Nowakowskiella sp. JEL0078]